MRGPWKGYGPAWVPLFAAVAVLAGFGLARSRQRLLDVAGAELQSAERVAREELRSRTRWFSSIVEQSSDVILLFDRETRVTWASPSTATVLGVEPEVFVGYPVLELVHRADRERVTAAMSRLSDERVISVEFRVRHGDGRWVWLETTAVDRRDDPDIAAVVTSSRDVTERHQRSEVLAHRASHDPLTGLINRSQLEDLLDDELALADADAPVSVAFIDLDDFKPVNDTHGHAVGDMLLRLVADRLRGAVRDGDVVSRLGGDEFVVVLRATGLTGALRIAERIRAALAEPFELPAVGEAVQVGASVGIATAGDDDSVGSLLHEADQALYEAKRRGRNRIEVASGTCARIDDEVDSLLRHALRGA